MPDPSPPRTAHYRLATEPRPLAGIPNNRNRPSPKRTKFEPRPLPKIYVIHDAKEVERARLFHEAYARAGLSFSIIEPVNGHGERAALRPFRKYLGDNFWGKSEIKPGAFGCFMSHLLAWREVAKGAEAYAIIAEDDSLPVSNFEQLWPNYEAQLAHCDLLFVNNRIASWASRRFENINFTIRNLLASDEAPTRASTGKTSAGKGGSFRAPGGDGYLISKRAAKKLVAQAGKDKVICGVDWYLVACGWNMTAIADPEAIKGMELRYLYKALGAREAVITAKIAGVPLFELVPGLPSTISHKTRLEIADFAAELA